MHLSAFEDHFGTNACLKSLGHGIHTPGFWAYATPINPQAAEDIKTALFIQQAQT